LNSTGWSEIHRVKIHPAYRIRFGLIFPRHHEPPQTLPAFVGCLREHVAETLGATVLAD